ncbi:MAG: glutamate--tRNA ligase [Patescibacteria group bacterium]
MSIFKIFFKKEKIRTRFAPSPTGPFHIGSVRTALFNFLFAKKFKGKFILRIEDTDLERSRPEYEKGIIESLKWLNIHWDEGPYRQSERLGTYAKYLKKLLDNGDAFYCFHSKKFLEEEAGLAHHCEFKKLPLEDLEKRLKKESAVIRFKTPPDLEIAFTDLIRGKIRFNSDALGGDFSLAKAESPDKFLPLYNFAVVIDDFEMGISHVIRGEDHISNTPKQILIQQALKLPMPKYAHLPLILGPDKSKLSKRHGAVSVDEYGEMGYLPAAMVNFIAFLGWNPGTDKEIFNLEELIKEFDLNNVQKGGAIFNVEKLDWFNGYYLKQLPLDELAKRAIPFLIKDGLIDSNFPAKSGPAPSWEYLKKILELERPRLKKLGGIGERISYFFKIPKYEPKLLIWRDMSFKDIIASLKASLVAIDQMSDADFNQKNLERILLKEAEKAKNKDKGRLLWPLRAALTGLEASPGPFEILEILGRKESIKRVETAIKKLA